MRNAKPLCALPGHYLNVFERRVDCQWRFLYDERHMLEFTSDLLLEFIRPQGFGFAARLAFKYDSSILMNTAREVILVNLIERNHVDVHRQRGLQFRR